MVIHQAIRVTQPLMPIHNRRKEIQEYPSIRIIEEDRLLGVSPRGNVVYCTRIFYA